MRIDLGGADHAARLARKVVVGQGPGSTGTQVGRAPTSARWCRGRTAYPCGSQGWTSCCGSERGWSVGSLIRFLRSRYTVRRLATATALLGRAINSNSPSLQNQRTRPTPRAKHGALRSARSTHVLWPRRAAPFARNAAPIARNAATAAITPNHSWGGSFTWRPAIAPGRSKGGCTSGLSCSREYAAASSVVSKYKRCCGKERLAAAA